MLDINRLMHVTPPLGTVRRMKRNADLDSTLGELLRKLFLAVAMRSMHNHIENNTWKKILLNVYRV